LEIQPFTADCIMEASLFTTRELALKLPLHFPHRIGKLFIFRLVADNALLGL
jgi:hypothetical protein